MTSIRKSLGSGIFYTGLARYSGVFFSIAIGAILARLLTPHEFGIVALVAVFVSFFGLLSDFGLGPAVIQNQKLTDSDVESIFSFSILLGFFLSASFFLCGPLIAGFYDEPALVNVARWLSLSVLFNSLLIIPKALFQKVLKFKEIGLVTVGVQLASGSLAIVMAYAGFSYYALVFQSILSGGLSLLIFYFLKPVKIAFRIDFSAIKKIIGFSFYQFLFNIINYFSRNSDNLLISKYLGLSSLGYYDKAYRLMMMPVSNLTHVITPVLMPVLAEHQENKSFVFQSYLKVVRILAIIGFPLSVFLYFTASEVITILFGPDWEASIPVFKLLALTLGPQIILSSTGSIFQVVNRTDLLFISGFLSAIIMVGGISYGVFIGQSLESVGWCLIGAFSINFGQGFYLLIKKALKASLLTLFQVLLYPVCVAAIMGVVLLFFDYQGRFGIWVSMMIKAILAAFVFFGLFGLRKEYRDTVVSELKKSKIEKKVLDNS